jgi:hypothetical protein
MTAPMGTGNTTLSSPGVKEKSVTVSVEFVAASKQGSVAFHFLQQGLQSSAHSSVVS